MVTKKQRNRLYKIHYNLRKKGNHVNGRKRSVIKRKRELTDIERKWLTELQNYDYCVSDDLFSE